MIHEIIIPTENTYILLLPDEFIGKEVEIIAFELTKEEPREFSTNPEERRAYLDNILKAYTFNSGGYKFNRDEANDYD